MPLANSNGVPTPPAKVVGTPLRTGLVLAPSGVVLPSASYGPVRHRPRNGPSSHWSKGSTGGTLVARQAGQVLLALDGVAAAATGRPVFGQRPGSPSTSSTSTRSRPSMTFTPGCSIWATDLTSTSMPTLSITCCPTFPPRHRAGRQGGGGHRPASSCRTRRAGHHGSNRSGKENDNDTYRDFYRFTGLRLKTLGCGLLRLDHSARTQAKDSGSQRQGRRR